MKKRTRRVVRSTRNNPIQIAVESAAVITESRNGSYRIKEFAALNGMATGDFGPDEWTTLLYITNQSELMAEEGMGIEVAPCAAKAQRALAEIRAGKEEHGTWRATPQQVFDLRELQAYHDLQRQSMHYGKYREYRKRTEDKMRTGSLPTYTEFLEKSDGHTT